ncbi:MAG: YbaN family protein, partial [Rhodocyclaceae bacterium]|nr:YbaN family protein [Rhodocyclaceae bacterium]
MQSPTLPSVGTAAPGASWRERGWRILGAVSVAIGIINAFIPVLPTTIFLIIGAWAWGKGAPEWRARLLAHPRYGPPLRLWLEQRMITRRGKRMCLFGLAASALLSSWLLGFRPLPTALLVGGLSLLGLWI